MKSTATPYEAYPLDWPEGYQRTPSYQRKRSQFKGTIASGRDKLKEEVRRLGGTELIISSDIPLNQNGDLRADYARFKMNSPGVAIYFKRKGKQVALCCDQYDNVWENLIALAKGIEAIRGMDRWGISDFLDKTFSGFAALPPADYKAPWWESFGYSEKPGKDKAEIVRSKYRELVKIHHPDTGGSIDKFQQIASDYAEAVEYFNNHNQIKN